MKAALQKVLAELDGLGDEAIKSRILGIGGEAKPEMAAEEVMESPAEQAGEDAVGAEGGGEDLDPALLEKLKALLSQ